MIVLTFSLSGFRVNRFYLLFLGNGIAPLPVFMKAFWRHCFRIM